MRPTTADPDDIQKCLNCTKPECTNCLSNPLGTLTRRQKYERFHVIQLDPKTKKPIAVYENTRAASEDTGISAQQIYRCSRGLCKFAGGYRWTTIEPR